jgi:hypothetical protein
LLEWRSTLVYSSPAARVIARAGHRSSIKSRLSNPAGAD